VLPRPRSLAFWLVVLLCLLSYLSGNRKTQAQSRVSLPSSDESTSEPFSFIYVSNFQANTVQIFSSTGEDRGVFCSVTSPIGLAFDPAGNLLVASDDATGYSIQEFAPDGSGSTFATNGLKAPHAIAIDTNGNVFVANSGSATIEKFTPDGIGSVFADSSDGVAHPVDLLFDATGNLFLTNANGGATGTGSVEKFTPDGTGSIFADSVFNTAYGLAIDSGGNVYVSDFTGNNVLKFAPDGTNLGTFVSTPLNGPHGMFFDSSDNLYVANNATNTIERFSSTGTYLGTFAQTGKGPHFFALSTVGPPPTPTPTPIAPSITKQPANRTVSLGQSATFSVTATGTAPLAYQWQKNGVDIPGANLATYTTPPAVTEDNGTLFQVIVSNIAGSVTSLQRTLTVNLPPTITTQPEDKTVIPGKTARFTVKATGTKTLTYQWKKNGADIPGATAASYTTPPVTTLDNGSLFSVVVTNPYGSATSTDAKLTVR